MKVGIDAHTLGAGAGGNETYMRDLLLSLREYGNGIDVLAFVHEHFKRDPEAAAGFPTHKLHLTSSYLRVPFELPWAARREKIDLLHVQYVAPPVCPCPYVVSMHDIVWLRLPDSLPAMTRYRLALLGPGTLRRAARIFVLTDAQRRSMAETYDIPYEKFDLVQPTLNPVFKPVNDQDTVETIKRKYGIEGDYILYLGQLQPRKNLVRLAETFAELVRKGYPQKLVIVGRRAWLYGDMLKQVEALNLGDRLVFTGYADREDLPALYSGAQLLAYVSLYEGFGIPVLEAMACGIPVLASSDPSIMEVADGAAYHVDEYDLDSIQQGLEALLNDKDLRDRLRVAGFTRAATFTRKRMAESAIRGYQNALAS